VADYYVVQGLVGGSNDGSSWADAWDNLESVVERAVGYDTYSAGDIIYVATHDNTSDISVSDNNTWQFATVTGGNDDPVTIIFDDGTKSDGSTTMTAGTFTKTQTGDAAAVNFSQSFIVLTNSRFVIKTNRTANHNIIQGGGYVKDLEVHLESSIQQQGLSSTTNNGYQKGVLTLVNPTVYLYGSTDGSRALFRTGPGTNFRVINPTIDFSNHSGPIANTSYYMFESRGSSNGTSRLEVQGGQIINAGNTFNLIQPFTSDASRFGGSITIDGLSLPSIMTSVAAGFLKAPEPELDVGASGDQWFEMRGGVDPEDMVYATTAAWAQVEESGLYPTLSAKFPDSASGTAYSMKIYPKEVSLGNPFKCPVVKKDYDLTAATKIIKVQLLEDERYTTILANPMNDYEVWIDVMYTDNATGDVVIESTRTSKVTAATLATSDASWTAASYSTIGYLKKEISLETTYAIKQYTEITVTLYVGRKAYDSNSFWFYDPDFSIT